MNSGPEHTPQKDQRSEEAFDSLRPPDRFDVRGQSADVVSALRTALDNPTLALAARLVCPEGAHTIKLVSRKSPGCEVKVKADCLVVEYQDMPRKIAQVSGVIQRTMIAKALIEGAIGALQEFARTITIPKNSTHDLLLLAEAMKGFKGGEFKEFHDVLADALRGEFDGLVSTQQRLLEKAQKVGSSSLLNSSNPASVIESAGESARRLAAVSLLLAVGRDLAHSRGEKLPPLKISKEEVSSAITGCVNRLGEGIEALWSRAFFEADGEKIKEVLSLRRSLQVCFTLNGFVAPLPPLFRPSSDVLALNNIATSAERQRVSQMQVSGGGEFPARLRQQTAHTISSAHAMRAYDRAIREWHTSDGDPTGYLREQLMDLVPHLSSACRKVATSLPDRLPEELERFIEALCRLRFQSKDGGPADFANLACQLSEQERFQLISLQRARVQAQLSGDTQDVDRTSGAVIEFLSQHIEKHRDDYTTLVNFVATWPLLTGLDDRDRMLGRMRDRLSTLIARTIYSVTSMMEEAFNRALSNEERMDPKLIAKFRRDMWGLNRAVAAIQHEPLQRYTGAATRVMRALLCSFQIDTLSPAQQSSHRWIIKASVNRLEHMSADQKEAQALSATFDAFKERALAHMRSQLSSIEWNAIDPEGLRREVDRCDAAGDLAGWVDAIAAMVAYLPQLSDSENRERLSTLIEDSARGLVDVIELEWESAIEERVADFSASKNGYENIRNVLESHKERLDQIIGVRDLFMNESFPSYGDWLVRLTQICQRNAQAIARVLEGANSHVAHYLAETSRRVADPANSSTEERQHASQFLYLPLSPEALSAGNTRAREYLSELLRSFNPNPFGEEEGEGYV